MISAIVLSILLHAQAVMPVLGSTQGTTGGAPAAPKIIGVAFSAPVGFSKPVAFQ